MGHSAAELHSNRSQSQRQEALKGFCNGKYRVMVATDIAARGIDVKNIELVINFDLPDQLEDYVHRIGRTGRAGLAGKAISFAAPEQKNDILQIERMIKTTLPVKTKSGELIARKPDARPTGSYGPGPRGEDEVVDEVRGEDEAVEAEGSAVALVVDEGIFKIGVL